MIPRPKRLPRLWCALQGLLPLESCLAAQRAELAWPKNLPSEPNKEAKPASLSAAGRVRQAK
jgi:hypothetical protein